MFFHWNLFFKKDKTVEDKARINDITVIYGVIFLVGLLAIVGTVVWALTFH